MSSLQHAPSLRERGRPSRALRSLRVGRHGYVVFVLPGLLAALLALGLPAYNLIANSLHFWHLSSATKQYDGLGQFSAVLSDPEWWLAVERTLVYSVVVVAIQLVIGVAIARLFLQDFRGIRVLRTLWLLPFVLLPAAVAILWRLIYIPEGGPLNYLLGLLHLPQHDWPGSSGTALASLAVADIWQTTPFVVLVLIAGFHGLPRNVLSAATLDGARWFRRLIDVELPQMRYVLLVIGLLRLIEAVKVFVFTYVITRGGPGSSTVSLGWYTYEQGLLRLNIGQASAAALLVSVFISLLTYPFVRMALSDGKGAS